MWGNFRNILAQMAAQRGAMPHPKPQAGRVYPESYSPHPKPQAGPMPHPKPMAGNVRPDYSPHEKPMAGHVRPDWYSPTPKPQAMPGGFLARLAMRNGMVGGQSRQPDHADMLRSRFRGMFR